MNKLKYNKKFFDCLIRSSERYYAHLPKEEDNRAPELLSEHSSLTCFYADKIIRAHSLESRIKNLIQLSIPDCIPESDRDAVQREIRRLFDDAIAYHDLGKVNHLFQSERMGNKSALPEVDHKFNAQHSVLSMYLYLAFSFSRLQNWKDGKTQIFLFGIAVYFSYLIHQHHSSSLYDSQNEEIWTDERLVSLQGYINLFQDKELQNINNEKFYKKFHEVLKCTTRSSGTGVFNKINKILTTQDNFPLYALLRLNYSLLTASDYLATAHYVNEWKEESNDFSLITEDLRQKIIQNVSNYSYNQELYTSLEQQDLPDPREIETASNKNLNLLRKAMAAEAIQNIRENADKNLFYLEAPTGGGKTNISILAAAELLKKTDCNKIFYVFPFTTLITQTFLSLKKILQVDENEIAEIHSKALFIPSEDEDANYLRKNQDEYENYIQGLFFNYPIVLLSHIRFFEFLKTNRKEFNYIFYRLANSIVILDEIQSYSPSVWDEVCYFIVHYAKLLNMKFIVMSATLPKIGNLLDGDFSNKKQSGFISLIKNKNLYFQNANFKNRVKFDYTLLEWNPPKSTEEREDYLLCLKEKVLCKSREYLESKQTDRVHTIIEFIYKKSASEFYSLFKDDEFFDEIYLLSGTILEPRRKKIIARLKSEDAQREKILLISTQVVEAGVDIDMDLGFKDKSIADSEEQLAGRINRNAKKTDSRLYLFDFDSARSIYGKDDRFRITNELKPDSYQKILEKKNFDSLYNEVIKKIKATNSSEFIDNLRNLESAVTELNYKKVNECLKLIEGSSISVYVPIDLPISYLEKEFLGILESLGISYTEKVISGRTIWEKYEELIKEKEQDFISLKIKFKKLIGIMSYFVFSVFAFGKDYEILKTYGEEKYGFLYLENYSDIYSIENGINVEKFADSIFI